MPLRLLLTLLLALCACSGAHAGPRRLLLVRTALRWRFFLSCFDAWLQGRPVSLVLGSGFRPLAARAGLNTTALAKARAATS